MTGGVLGAWWNFFDCLALLDEGNAFLGKASRKSHPKKLP
jgi:hypothetical protein